jgi:hypothetical protein
MTAVHVVSMTRRQQLHRRKTSFSDFSNSSRTIATLYRKGHSVYIYRLAYFVPPRKGGGLDVFFVIIEKNWLNRLLPVVPSNKSQFCWQADQWSAIGNATSFQFLTSNIKGKYIQFSSFYYMSQKKRGETWFLYNELKFVYMFV